MVSQEGRDILLTSSAVENGVGSQNGHDLPWPVAVLKPHVVVEEIQGSCEWKEADSFNNWQMEYNSALQLS